ncbi:MAG: CoA transferase [Pseudomonadota bacterium]
MDAAPGQTTEARADLPLAGMRVIAVEQYGAGPFGTMHLADLGAEVIKIEQPDTGGPMPGDNARHSDTRKLGKNDSQFFQSFNRNKKSVALDLKQDAGQEAFRRLVAGADAVLNNLRGDIPAKLGVDYAALSAVKPAIVCVHVSGYGRSGDRARWPAYDYLLQAEAGFMSVTGEPDGVPTRMGLSMVDYATGITAALALVSAVMGARATGRGRDFDVTLYDTAMHLLTYPAAWWLNAGYETARRPRSGHPHIVPCEVYPTADGEVIVMCVKPKFWELLAEELGLAALIDDPRFKTNADRFENRDALAAEMDAAFRKATTADWLARLSGKVPVSPVRSLGDALDNDFFVSRGGAQSVPHPHAPDMRLVANPIRPEGKVLPARAGPALGADTDACLRDAGYDEDEIARLHAEKVVS